MIRLPEQHLTEAGALLLQERDELERQAEAELVVQPADLERLTTPSVPSYLPPFRFESQWEPIPNTGSRRAAGCGPRACPTGSCQTSKPSASSAP